MLHRVIERIPSARWRLVALVGGTLLVGTVFYHNVEEWSWIDSFYFSVITLTTIGYGDLHPTTEISKLFTIGYIFVGLGLIAAIINDIGQNRLRRLRGEANSKSSE